MKSQVAFAGATDIGLRRANNEDAYVVRSLWNDNTVLAVVIDGVGGYEGGERAAEIAQEKIVEYLENYPVGERTGLLKRAVVYANNAIYEERTMSSQYARMSCVLTAVIVDYDCKQIFMAHVGDTRLYSYTDETLTKLSHDHSFVGFYEEIGELTELEAMQHPERNVISRVVGGQLLQNSEEDYIEVSSFRLAPHSILLLCSDGLCDMITSSQMKEILQQEISLDDKVNALIAAANAAGGKDNVTVVLVESAYDKNSDTEPATPILNGNVEEEINPTEDKESDRVEENNQMNDKAQPCRWKIAAIITWSIIIIIGIVMGIMSQHYTIVPNHEYSEKPVVVCDSTENDTIVLSDSVVTVPIDSIKKVVIPHDSITTSNN